MVLNFDSLNRITNVAIYPTLTNQGSTYRKLCKPEASLEIPSSL